MGFTFFYSLLLLKKISGSLLKKKYDKLKMNWNDSKWLLKTYKTISLN